MTIVELFDEKPINNIIGALAFHPERIVYIGGLSQRHFENRKLPILKRFFAQKQMPELEIRYVQVRKDSLQDIIARFEEIRAAYDDCNFHIEVTGGEELVLIALGVLCERYPSLRLYQISSKLRHVRTFSVAGEDGVKTDMVCRNSVRENLMLHGASVISADGSDFLPEGWQFTDDFMHDLGLMWETMRSGIDECDPQGDVSPYNWNQAISSLGRLYADFALPDDPNCIQVGKPFFHDTFLLMPEHRQLQNYLFYFLRLDLLDYRIGEETVELEFKNAQVRKCLTTAGILLELKTYLICRGLTAQRGGDCMTGVQIAWDGEESAAADAALPDAQYDPDAPADTVNEVDVIASCGMVPYFISCKNGQFTAEELYKLYAVSEQFGKGYCKRILVTTSLRYAVDNARQRLQLLQRAEDMGIVILEDVHTMTDADFSAELARVMELPKVKSLQTVP